MVEVVGMEEDSISVDVPRIVSLTGVVAREGNRGRFCAIQPVEMMNCDLVTRFLDRRNSAQGGLPSYHSGMSC